MESVHCRACRSQDVDETIVFVDGPRQVWLRRVVQSFPLRCNRLLVDEGIADMFDND